MAHQAIHQVRLLLAIDISNVAALFRFGWAPHRNSFCVHEDARRMAFDSKAVSVQTVCEELFHGGSCYKFCQSCLLTHHGRLLVSQIIADKKRIDKFT